MSSQQLLIATHNAKKSGEMITILRAALPGVDILTLADFPNASEPEETGTTYEQNAIIKASSAFRETQIVSIGDDSGLEIDFLDGAPGLFSKRFGGEELPFPEKMAKILEMLQGVAEEKRTAQFRCCVAIDTGEHVEIVEDVCKGRIASEPSGRGGFGYDPIFFLPEKGCTMADLPTAEKHTISHRGKVLARAAVWLKSNLVRENELA